MDQRQAGEPPRPRAKRARPTLFAAPEFYREREITPTDWFERLFEPAAVVGAVTLFSLGIVQFVLSVAPGWPADGLVVLCGAASLAAYLYSRRLARGSIIWREWLVFLVPVLLLARVLPYPFDASLDLVQDLGSWTADPTSVLDVGFLIRAALIFGAWWTGFASAQDLYGIRVQPGEVSDVPTRTVIERAWESDRVRSIDHTGPFRRLSLRFLQGGLLLVFLSALTASNVRQTLSFEALGEMVTLRRPASSVALASVVAYFVVVLLLMVEAEYARSRTLWTLDRIPTSGGISTRWASAGVLLIAAGLVFALLAPAEGLLGLGDILYAILGVLGLLAGYAGLVLYVLLFLVLYPLRWLMGGGTDGPPAPSMPVPPPPPPATDGGSALLELIRSAVFWLVLAAAFVYSASAMWRRGVRAGLVRLGGSWLERLTGRVLAMLRALVRFGRWALLGARQVVRTIVPRGAAGSALLRARGALAGALPGRDPRRVIVAVYSLMLARAGQVGLERHVGQTATEYREKLRAGLPTAASDVDELTDAFLRARYSRQPIVDEDAGMARRAWSHIRRRLVGRR